MIECLRDYEFVLIAIGTLSTTVLAVAAICAVKMAKRNLNAINEQVMTAQEQNRLTTLFEAIYQIREVRERNNRGVIAQAWNTMGFHPKDKNEGKQHLNNVITNVWQAYENGKDPKENDLILKNAVEETVVCLDKVGFFLRKLNDNELINDIPSWVFSITEDMWNRLGGYIEFRHGDKDINGVSGKKQAEPNWGRYFKELYDRIHSNNTLQKLATTIY